MGQSVSWLGPAYGSWLQPRNWSSDAVPVPADLVWVSHSIASVDGLVLDGLAITLGSDASGVQAGLQLLGTVTLTQSSTVQGLPGGTAVIQATQGSSLQLAGALDVVGNGNGETFRVDGNGTIAVSASGTITVQDGWLQLSPQMTSSGLITVGNGSLIDLGGLSSDGTIALSAGGYMRASGGLTSIGSIIVDGAELDTNGVFSSTGTILLSAGATMEADGSLANDGTITMASGSFLAANGGISGTGRIVLGSGSVFSVNAPVAATQLLQFADQTGLLSIKEPSDFQGAIAGLRPGDIIDLTNTKADRAILSGGVLVVSFEGTEVARFDVAGSSAPAAFATRDDGGFGTLLLSSNATRSWGGGDGSWFAATGWTTSNGPDGAPLAGDHVQIGQGSVLLDGRAGPLRATDVQLGGPAADPPTLQLQNIDIDSTSAIVIAGAAHAAQIDISGQVTLDGAMTASSIGGVLRIGPSDGAAGGTLTIDSGAFLAAGAGAAVKVAGITLTNDGLIDAIGRVDLSRATSLAGGGTVEIDHAGIAVVGTVDSGQNVQFDDDTGRLVLNDVGNFHGWIQGFAPGDAIVVHGAAVGAVSYVNGMLTLSYNGSTIGSFGINTSSYYEDVAGKFVFSPDRAGDTVIRYQATKPFVNDATIPVAAVGAATDMVSLRSILVNAFGSVPQGFASYTLYTREPNTDLTGYWGQATQDPPGSPVSQAWFRQNQNGTVTELDGVAGVTVTAADIDNIMFRVGNNIDSRSWFQVTVAGTDCNPVERLNYHMVGVDPHVNSFDPGVSIPDAQSQTESIDRFNAFYTDVQNSDYCPWIADDVAAGHGATMPWQDESTDPDDNREGGFWRIVHNGLDEPVADWYKLIKKGDVVRMGWAGLDGDGLGQHTTSIYKVVDDGPHTVAKVWDNNDYRNDGNIDYIGMHEATYWDATVPQSITIYRLDSNNQYLIQGTDVGEYIQGSVFNNLIEPGLGADTIAAGAGNNEMRGSAADLDGDSIVDFHAGDWLDLTDLPFRTAALAYDADTGGLDVSSDGKAAHLVLPAGLAREFALAADGAGGTLVTLACYVPGTRIGVPGDADGVPIEHLRIGDEVIVASGGARRIRWIGRRSYNARFAAASTDVHPILIRAGALDGTLPVRDLRVSPHHAMLLDGMLVEAEMLVNGVSVRREAPVGDVSYVHLELDRHDAVLAEGAWSETFEDDNSRGMFHNAHEFAALFPGESRRAPRYCAPRLGGGDPRLAALRARIDGVAGIRPPEPLRGGIEGWQGFALRGWAQNPDRPDLPVLLEVLLDGTAVAQAVADLFRLDLRAAGLGGGCHGFRIELPPDARHRALLVRRAADGLVLANRPAEPKPQPDAFLVRRAG
ncbi:Hint domain-containing protein [Rhizosaccharibacter radicis]|uniref:Hint domain-containing protein n=1 Tax=Rhizosaccharibacter radicis TaxID=2782605 RepID=A0ABT1VW94_9PROT|nr:Hint domain-containing protein [Acetobacteraceae bacterium KSS12]